MQSTGETAAPEVPRARLIPRRAPLPAATLAGLERELKFIVPDSRVAFVGAWLRRVCAPDPVHPPARVVTVYFDTARLELLDEKINSDYLKTKVRVRWYEAPDGSPSGDALFVEAKLRVGSTRQKVRRPAEVPAAAAARWPLDHREWSALLEPLRLHGVDLPRDLLPVMRLSYVRERLVDRAGGGRVTIDSRMAIESVNPLRVRVGLVGRMPGAVVEYKGRTPDLPAHLRLLTASGGRRASFSKYLAGYVHATRTML